MRAKQLQSCLNLCDPMDCSQPPLSLGFSRQEYWSVLPCHPPGDLSDPRIESVSLISPALAGRCFTTSATWEAQDHNIQAYRRFFLPPKCLTWSLADIAFEICSLHHSLTNFSFKSQSSICQCLPGHEPFYLIKVTVQFHYEMCDFQFPFVMGFPGSSVSNESTCNVGDRGLIPGLGSSPGKWKGYLLQY